jgi:hypothetical protein
MMMIQQLCFSKMFFHKKERRPLNVFNSQMYLIFILKITFFTFVDYLKKKNEARARWRPSFFVFFCIFF